MLTLLEAVGRLGAVTVVGVKVEQFLFWIHPDLVHSDHVCAGLDVTHNCCSVLLQVVVFKLIQSYSAAALIKAGQIPTVLDVVRAPNLRRLRAGTSGLVPHVVVVWP